MSVAFQQAPDHAVDDLVVRAERLDEPEPSMVLELAVRRSPQLVRSHESTQGLIRQFVHAVINAPTDGLEHRLGLVVAGPQPHAVQLATLADHAATQMDAPGFFRLIHTPGRFNKALRGRLEQVEQLVACALDNLGTTDADTAFVRQRVWQVLALLPSARN